MPLFHINGKIVLFVHVPKTGGQTIEEILQCHGTTAMLQKSEDIFFKCSAQHLHAALYNKLVPPKFVDFAFMVVRNPYRRAISEYFWNYGGRLRRGNPAPPFGLWLPAILQATKVNPFYLDNHMRPQWEFQSPHVKVFRFEDGIEKIVSDVAGEIGIPPPDTVPGKNAQHPTISITRRSLDMIRRHYAADFSEFGYDDDYSDVATLYPDRGHDLADVAARSGRYLKRRLRLV